MLDIIVYSIKLAEQRTSTVSSMEAEFDSIMEFWTLDSEEQLYRDVNTHSLGFWLAWCF
jgi:hypothetical protein